MIGHLRLGYISENNVKTTDLHKCSYVLLHWWLQSKISSPYGDKNSLLNENISYRRIKNYNKNKFFQILKDLFAVKMSCTWDIRTLVNNRDILNCLSTYLQVSLNSFSLLPQSKCQTLTTDFISFFFWEICNFSVSLKMNFLLPRSFVFLIKVSPFHSHTGNFKVSVNNIRFYIVR